MNIEDLRRLEALTDQYISEKFGSHVTNILLFLPLSKIFLLLSYLMDTENIDMNKTNEKKE